MKPVSDVIVVADGRRATAYILHPRARGVAHLSELATLANLHENEHEHQRPTLLGGHERRDSLSRSGASAAPHGVSQRHTADEEMARFAREVGAWLDAACDRADTGRTIVFAPPRFLGALRKQCAGRRATIMVEGELSHLSVHELAAHPALARAVEGA